MNYLEELTQRTIHEKIVKMVYKKGSMSFGEIKNCLKGVHNNTIDRELRKLMTTEPPMLLKSEDKKYSINKEHPDLEAILSLLRIMPRELELYPVFSQESEIIPQLGFNVTIATKHTEGYEQDIKDIFEKSNISDVVQNIFFELRDLKILRDIANIKKCKNLEEISEYDVEELYNCTFDVYITSATRNIREA